MSMRSHEVVPQVKPEDVFALRLNEEALARGVLDRNMAQRAVEPGRNTPFRLSGQPFRCEVGVLERIGNGLTLFQAACVNVYAQADKDSKSPIHWVAQLAGGHRSEALRHVARTQRARRPMQIIRPDLIWLGEGRGYHGWIAAEIDVMPGGLPTSAVLSQLHQEAEMPGIINRFESSMLTLVEHLTINLNHKGGAPREPGLLFVLDPEWSANYRAEATYFARRLTELGVPSAVCDLADLGFDDAGRVTYGDRPWPVIYRYFQLFFERKASETYGRLFQAHGRGMVDLISTPHAPALEEKLWFALWHHPLLRDTFVNAIPVDERDETVALLDQLLPAGWVLDPALREAHSHPWLQLLPSFVRPSGQPLRSFGELLTFSQGDRAELLIKASGGSAKSTRCGGIVIGAAGSNKSWRDMVEQALAEFPETRYVLQRYYAPQTVEFPAYSFARGVHEPFKAAVRLNPFYANLPRPNRASHERLEHTVLMGGVATICPADRSKLHGAADAVSTPIAAFE